ncbi:NAD(P)H-dependent flavin oxidoreductase [Amycolatopsis sp. A1MSW2902]|uniref:NAD(P)H-dependent flavin oxidoreductase n=1 Tax=Amycolatopsis sp. A1MSW2902 TaxID=687413 RepID=UPI00307DD759
MSTFEQFKQRLRIPAVAAPMFLVSGPDLVIAACRSGVAGAFPTANARDGRELADWLRRIHAETGPDDAPVAANLIVHRSNGRLAEDLGVLLADPVELVITSVGSPAEVIAPLHEAGTLVFSDVASIRHARRAADAGADGLILLAAGAGGQTGWANPFAFVRAVRGFYAGPLVLAGGLSDGVALRAACALGADLGYLGTRFLATTESMAADGHKRMVAESTLDDVVLTSAFTGLPASMLAPSIAAAGIDLAALKAGTADLTDLLSAADGAAPARWRDLWSAGHSASGVADVLSVAEVVARLAEEYG